MYIKSIELCYMYVPTGVKLVSKSYISAMQTGICYIV